ncbi:MAG TPA: CHAT domain-containing protein, partial [Caulobacteraceae bacterium]|nr:CHAT domain-containing protein [Caulobacteraceae bacterium]
ALPVKEVQALLAPNEGMILILSNPEAAYVWGVSKTKVTWARAEDLNEKALAETVATLRVGLSRKVPSRAGGFVKPGASASKFDGAAAHLVYDRLIRPVEGAFEGVDTLIAVPTGPLNSLPLAALVTRAPTADAPAKAGDFLIDRYAVAVLPSVSSLKALRCQLAREGTPRSSACPAGSAGRRQAAIGGERLTLAGFGAPTIGSAASAGGTERSAGDMTVRGLADPEALRKLSYLPGSLAELEALKARSPKSLIKVGDAATETAVRATYRDQLARADNVIFSTHGLVAGTAFTADGNGAVAEPGLVLTPPKSASAADDGFLSASEAAQLRLSADFVVLSACNTAAPDGRPGAEGLSGLARAFFYAGARSVLVSHWEVSDAATSALMVSAFDAARDRSVGGRAKAMRKAMLEVRADPKHADPYFWAPFALVGEPAV